MSDLSHWTQRHLSRVKEDFEAADKDKSGFLSFAEVFNVLKISGFKGTEDEAKRIFKDLDVDKNDGVSKDEFCSAMAKIPKIDFKMIVMRRAFKKIDQDNSGLLTRDEVIAAASQDVGLNVTAEKIADMLIAQVKDEDHKLNYDEFLAIWGLKQTTDTMRKVFCDLDKEQSGTLPKETALTGIKSEPELSMRAIVICQMLDKWCQGKIVIYAEFCTYYEENAPKN